MQKALLVQAWLRSHPEVSVEFEITPDQTVIVMVLNPEKTKILSKRQFSPKQLEQLIARLEGFFT